MSVVWMDFYRFIHCINMFYFYYLRYLNFITHKALSAGVEITVSPLLCRDRLGHLYSKSAVQTGKWSKPCRNSRDSGVTDFVYVTS